VVQGPKAMTSPRPKLGSHFRVTANSRISRMPEGRQRDPDQRDRHQRLRQEGAASERRVDAHRDAGQQRDHGRGERELEGRRQAFGDQRGHLSALTQAEAEFAARCVADEADELDREGLVEPEVGAQLGALLRRRVLTEDVGDRIADVLEQHEGDEGHAQHDEERLTETT
jgi:hypothetical protein